MTPEQRRRLLHAGTGLILLGPALGSWTALRAVLAAGTPVVLVVEWLRLRRPAVARVLASAAPAFRPGEDARVSGAVWLWIGYALAVWCPPLAAQGGILAGALADPAASLVGSRWGRGARKSWAGTGAAAGVAGTALLLNGMPWLVAVSGGLVAGALERWSGPLDDNLTVAPGVAVYLWLVS